MRVFIIIPFSSEFAPILDVIEKAIHDAKIAGGAQPICMKGQVGAGTITEQMVEEIKRAALVIADISGLNPNVMWELGFAAALQKPRNILRREGSALPFDISVERAESYDPSNLGQLKKTVTKSVEATVARVTASPKHFFHDPLYDEVCVLSQTLRECRIPIDDRNIVLLETLVKAVRRSRRKDWTEKTSIALLFENIQKVVELVDFVDEAFWWLIVYGVLEYHDTECFYKDDEDGWSENADLVRFSHRGVRLLNAIAQRE